MILPLLGAGRTAPGGGGPAPGDFVPTDLGSSVLKAWFDFGDTGSITESSGAVSQVNDKSGNSNHISQATAGSKPGTGAQTLNGLNVLTFDGGDALFKDSALSLPTADPGCTLIALRLFTSGTSGGLAWIVSQSGSFGDVAALGRESGNMGVWGNAVSSSAGIAALYADADNTNWHLSSGIYTTASRSIYEDGSLMDTDNNGITTNAVTAFYVGQCLNQARGAGLFLTGRLAQVFVLAGTDATNRQKIEGWTMWEYGLEGNLPGGHPYASAPP